MPRPALILLWSANGDPVYRVAARDLRTNAPFVMWDGLRYERCPRQSETARVVHFQTTAILRRQVP